jgi:hypothetical protein
LKSASHSFRYNWQEVRKALPFARSPSKASGAATFVRGGKLVASGGVGGNRGEECCTGESAGRGSGIGTGVGAERRESIVVTCCINVWSKVRTLFCSSACDSCFRSSSAIRRSGSIFSEAEREGVRDGRGEEESVYELPDSWLFVLVRGILQELEWSRPEFSGEASSTGLVSLFVDLFYCKGNLQC